MKRKILSALAVLAIAIVAVLPVLPVTATTTLAVNKAAVFQNYVESGDMLIVAEITNNSTSYYGDADSGSIFNLQLVSTNNITIIAASPQIGWDRMPESIYINAALAATLTDGFPYYVRLQELTSGNTSAQYTLTAADWKGTDLRKLDAFVINIAKDMDTFYGYSGDTSLITYVATTQQFWGIPVPVGNVAVLTEKAGVLFNAGIQGLQTQRPNLFRTTINKPRLPTDTANPVYQNAKNWQTEVGSTGADLGNTIGDFLGVDGQVALGMVFGAIILTMILAGLAMGGLGLVLAYCSLPLVFWANSLRVIDIQVTMVLIFVLGMIAIIKFLPART